MESRTIGRRIAAALLALAALAAGARADDGVPEAEARFVRLVKELRHEVVVVDCFRDGNGPLESRSSFCGVVLDARGHVATFGPRVAEADRIEVELSDGRRLPARRLASDRETSISVLAIEDPPSDLRPVRLGDSDALEVGATLIAIGNPFGFKHSVSTGIVSGLDRVIHSSSNTFTGMIQSTVPVNPGDAGGLVANSRGECVGLIASTFGRSGGADPIRDLLVRIGQDPDLQARLERLQRELQRVQSDPELTPPERMRRLAELFMEMQGLMAGERSSPPGPATDEESIGAQAINFVMPINTVRWIAQGLIAEGKVTRGWLGVTVDVRLEAAREAVFVSEVLEGGPAATGGLRAGDRILSYLNEEIDRLDVLRRLTVRTPPGKKITIDVERNGERLRLEVVMGERP